jgi:ribosomal protein S18 acetylase RimI-like enzyme
MTRYRAFRNSDPPAIAEIWRSQKSVRSLAQSVTPAMLDRMVFAKPYFDRRGFLVAEDEGRPVGFVHAGFAANETLSDLDHAKGVISLLLVAPHQREDEIAAELLEQAQNYLRNRGAKSIYATGFAVEAAPFYMGLLGGCVPAGVPESNEQLSRWVRACHPAIDRRIVIMQCSLAAFRPVVNRDQMQIRRRFQTEAELDPPSLSWWEACTTGFEHRTRFKLLAREGDVPCGVVTYWDMEPIASSWGVHACGLLDLTIDASRRREGLGTFLASESLRQMQSQGATLAECHIDESNAAGIALCKKLGFSQVELGVVFRSDL